MTTLKNELKKILKASKKVAEEVRENSYSNVWINRTKETDDGDYLNQPSSIKAMLQDVTDDYIYNIWHNATEEGLEDYESFVENELVPAGLSMLPETQMVSKKNTAIRYMIVGNQ